MEKAALIYSTLGYPEASFQFSHELIRSAVLSELSAPRRQRLHLNVASSGIERVHANALEDQAGNLAHHLWQAGRAADPDKTVHFLKAAVARQALKQSAYEGALRYFQNALELLKGLPYSQDRARRELELQIDYGLALLATKRVVRTRKWATPIGALMSCARVLVMILDSFPVLFRDCGATT